MSQEFTKTIEKELAGMCMNLGFRIRSGHRLFKKKISDNMAFSIGFSISSYRVPHHRMVAPKILVFYDDFERIYKFLLDQGDMPIVSIALGYVMPIDNWLEFDFEEGMDNHHVLEEMKGCIMTWGMSFFEKANDFNRLIKMIEDAPRDISTDKNYVLPLMYYINGDKRKGINYIKERIDWYKNTEGLITEEFIRGWFENDEQKLNEYLRKGLGKVDPNYYVFAERYAQLPDNYKDWRNLYDSTDKAARQ